MYITLQPRLMTYCSVWTDPPSSPLALLSLVNNLDLQLITPRGSINGNQPFSPLANAAPSFDRFNNVEVVMLDVKPGDVLQCRRYLLMLLQTFTVVVNGSAVPIDPQPYAIVITAPPGTVPVLPCRGNAVSERFYSSMQSAPMASSLSAAFPTARASRRYPTCFAALPSAAVRGRPFLLRVHPH
jgi:hypothetical protein